MRSKLDGRCWRRKRRKCGQKFNEGVEIGKGVKEREGEGMSGKIGGVRIGEDRGILGVGGG